MTKKKVLSGFLTICIALGVLLSYKLIRKHPFGENPSMKKDITYEIEPIYEYRYKYLMSNGEWSEYSPWLDYKPMDSSLRYIESRKKGYKLVPQEKTKNQLNK